MLKHKFIPLYLCDVSCATGSHTAPKNVSTARLNFWQGVHLITCYSFFHLVIVPKKLNFTTSVHSTFSKWLWLASVALHNSDTDICGEVAGKC